MITDGATRSIPPYDPIADWWERFPDWTLAARKRLPSKALVSHQQQAVLVDWRAWQEDADGVLTLVMAMLDLGLVPPAGGEASPGAEEQAADLARLRLDRWALPEVDGAPSVQQRNH